MACDHSYHAFFFCFKCSTPSEEAKTWGKTNRICCVINQKCIFHTNVALLWTIPISIKDQKSEFSSQLWVHLYATGKTRLQAQQFWKLKVIYIFSKFTVVFHGLKKFVWLKSGIFRLLILVIFLGSQSPLQLGMYLCTNPAVFIWPRSDHSLRLSVTDWLTDYLVEDWMNWPKYADYTD